MNDSVLSLPFDQYQRYRLVADLVRSVEQDGRKRTLLDVGGRTGVLRKFLPEHAVTLVDVEPSDIPDVVIGDGRKLPFKDKSFDIVAAFDTLEHVPAEGRDAFVDECARVAREQVVLVGPYAHPAVDEAEELLLRFLEDFLGEKHRYLREHRANTLPSMERTVARLAKRGAQTATIAHGNVERWLGLMCLSLYMDHEPHLRPLATRMHRFWNEALHESDTGEPAYRHAVVASFVGAPPRVVYTQKADALPAKVLAGARVLSTKLVEFEAARRDWRAEKLRLEEVVKTFRLDLAGHKQTLKESQAKEAQALQVVDTLRADLQGHAEALRASAASLLAQQAEANTQKAELEADLERHKSVVAEREARLVEYNLVAETLREDLVQTKSALVAVQADLDGHRATVTALRVEEAALRDETLALGRDVSSLQAHSTELEHALAEHKLVLADREQQLAAWQQVLAEREALLAAEQAARVTLEEDLAGHKAALVETRADLDGHRTQQTALRAELERLEVELRAALADVELGRAAAEAARHALLREQALVAERERDLHSVRAEIDAHVRVQQELGAQLAALTAELMRREDLEREARIAFASVRSELEADLARHREAYAVLEKDLAGHKTLVDELRVQLTHVEDALRSSAADLEAERASAEGLRHELAGERLALADTRQRAAALESLLDEHRAVVRDLSADLEGHRGALQSARSELSAQAASITRLEGEWAASEERHLATQAQLAHERAVRSDLESQVARAREALAAQDAKISLLRGLLANRWVSLKRALWVKKPLP